MKHRRISFSRSIHRLGLSQRKLAEALHVSPSTINRWVHDAHARKRARLKDRIEKLEQFARRYRRRPLSKEEQQQRFKRLKKTVRVRKVKVLRPPGEPIPPPETQPQPPPEPQPQPPAGPEAITELEQLPDTWAKLARPIAELGIEGYTFYINGQLLLDTPLGWKDDHAWQRAELAVQEGDDSEIWRITPDYDARVDHKNRIVYINFDPIILTPAFYSTLTARAYARA